MIKVKPIEIRDKGTFIPALAIQKVVGPDDYDYLYRRAGWAVGHTIVWLINLTTGECHHDPFEWGYARTYGVVHSALLGYPEITTGRRCAFDDVPTGGVIDVEWLLGERDEPKISERLTGPPL